MDIFFKFCPHVYKISSMINKIYYEYQIENYITNNKELFDGTNTIRDHVLMC